MSLVIRKPDDFHVHFRQGDMLKTSLPASADFARCLVMPNTKPAIRTMADLAAYRVSFARAAFTPLFTFETAGQNRDEVRLLKEAGAVAGKLYPKGVTTNSEQGADELRALDPVFAAMEEFGLVLSIHGELPGAFSLDREEAFLPAVVDILERFPRLKVVLEHLSTHTAVDFVLSGPANLAATITAHHLRYTLDDLLGAGLRPHLFCKPIVKRSEDRTALRIAACSGNPKFFFGSDSAPHPGASKAGAEIPAGCFTAPVALPLLAAVFEEENALDKLQDFTGAFGADFYGLPRNEATIALEKNRWRVPESYGVEAVVPLCAGETLDWSVRRG